MFVSLLHMDISPLNFGSVTTWRIWTEIFEISGENCLQRAYRDYGSALFRFTLSWREPKKGRRGWLFYWEN